MVIIAASYFLVTLAYDVIEGSGHTFTDLAKQRH